VISGEGRARRGGMRLAHSILEARAAAQAVFRNPTTDVWETDDAYHSGSVRTKLAMAEPAAERDPQYARALRRVQTEDLLPSDITARLGAP